MEGYSVESFKNSLGRLINIYKIYLLKNALTGNTVNYPDRNLNEIGNFKKKKINKTTQFPRPVMFGQKQF